MVLNHHDYEHRYDNDYSQIKAIIHIIQLYGELVIDIKSFY